MMGEEEEDMCSRSISMGVGEREKVRVLRLCKLQEGLQISRKPQSDVISTTDCRADDSRAKPRLRLAEFFEYIASAL